jgi:hypothetical protein
MDCGLKPALGKESLRSYLEKTHSSQKMAGRVAQAIKVPA